MLRFDVKIVNTKGLSKGDSRPPTKPRRSSCVPQSSARVYIRHKTPRVYIRPQSLARVYVRPKAPAQSRLPIKALRAYMSAPKAWARPRLLQSLARIFLHPQSLGVVLSTHKALFASTSATKPCARTRLPTKPQYSLFWFHYQYHGSMVSTSHIGLVVLPTDFIV